MKTLLPALAALWLVPFSVLAQPILTKPETDLITTRTAAVQFTLTEAAKNGTLKLSFDDGTNPPIELTLTDAQGTVGTHTFSFNAAAPTDSVSSGAIASATGPIPDETYEVTLGYLDANDDPVTAAANTNVVIDGVLPALDLTPLLLTVNESGAAEVPDLSDIASDLNGIAEFTQNPAAGLEIGSGDSLVEVRATDGAGNVATGLLVLTVGFERPMAPHVEPVAKTGDGNLTSAIFGVAAPTGASLVAPLGAPAISDTRTLVAKGTLQDGRKKLACLYQENAQRTAGLIAFQGSPVPDLAGATFKSFGDPLISPDGLTVVFAAKVAGGGTDKTTDDGVWRVPFDSAGSTAELLLQEGSDVPGLDTGIRLKTLQGLSLRSDGVLAFVQLARVPGEITAANDFALVLVRDAADGLLLRRTGDPFPDEFTPETTIKTITILAPTVTSPGHGRWHTDGLVTARYTLADKRMVLVQFDATGTETILGVTGEDSGFGDDSLWKSFGLPAQCAVTGDIIGLGTLAPLAGVVTKNNDTALGATWGGAFSVVQREGGDAPLDDAVWAGFSDPVMNDLGLSAFLATLKGTGVTKANRTTLWWGDAGNPTLLARVAHPDSEVPDPLGTPVTGRLWAGFTSLALPHGEGSGPIFIAKVKGTGVKPTSNLGLYGVDTAGQTRELLRTGDPIDFGGTTGVRTVKTFTLLKATPGSYAVGRSYNAMGSVAVLVTFTDKSQGLVRVDVP